ncbi:MAG: hypothetical protein A3F46_01790 [Legionellales bacterium RIFCSPHIGHO2_12_FULL_42_9]|nr:MAG: hypothetical protein A3F46_01790 [Legionellales bacterium RIFCSPHIGHO2_12_FULL_42_9]
MSYINFNGQVIPATEPCIQTNDRGLTLGDGLFETILIRKSSIPALAYHWKRLETSAPIIGLSIPFPSNTLETMLLALIEKNNLHDKIAGARLTLTSGNSARGILPAPGTKPNFFISVFEHAPLTKVDYSAVIVRIKKNEHAPSSRIKSTSYLDNVLAKKEAVTQGYDEAILLNTANHIADGAISNIFMVKNQHIYTPRIADGALPGVVRTILLDEFSNAFSLTEKSMTIAELIDADEVFVTNALMGIKPVTKLQDKHFMQFPCALGLQAALRERKDYL